MTFVTFEGESKTKVPLTKVTKVKNVPQSFAFRTRFFGGRVSGPPSSSHGTPMPRGTRLDYPGALHHLMARGIERSSIFLDERDRRDFLARLDRLVETGAISIYAFSLMPTHIHLLARTGSRSISRAMSSLLTGYAVSFNRRHDRVGHLFQNRFKSILCEESEYFRELVRYIHLNPVRAGLLTNLDELDHDPTTGHAVILGNRYARFLEAGHVLQAFGPTRETALSNYRAFIAAGLDEESPQISRRSVTERTMAALAGRGRQTGIEERILGGRTFAAEVRRDIAPLSPGQAHWNPLPLIELIHAIADATGAPRGALTTGNKLPACSKAREGLAFLWIDCLGKPGRQLAHALRIRPESLCRVARRGRRDSERWLALFSTLGLT